MPPTTWFIMKRLITSLLLLVWKAITIGQTFVASSLNRKRKRYYMKPASHCKCYLVGIWFRSHPHKMAKSNYDAFIDKITGRIRCWTFTTLSFARRLQLINSVLFSIHTYWTSLFVLPKVVTKNIESIYRNYLYSPSMDCNKIPPITWGDLSTQVHRGVRSQEL